MSTRQIIPLFVMVCFAANVKADSSAYVVSAGITGDGIFGTVDLNTGAFQQIGPVEPDGYFGLAQGPNGSLAALTYAGNLVSINAATGVPTQIGATGLGACVVPTPACGPTSAFSLGGLNGTIYATDYANSVFVINPSSGAATLLAHNSGIPASPFVLGSRNANGTFNFGDEAIWQSGGKLYATYDAWIFDPTSSSIASIAVAPELYQIDPTSGLATAIGPTALGIGGVADVNGTNYAFDDITNQILSLDLANGSTSVVGAFDSSAGVVQGAAPVPEPRPFMLLGAALLGLAAYRRSRLSFQRAK
ncbi:MAG: hypothetical protein JO145_13945 [Acidobacteriaceae bacterium]|nr:hypothetical protein [Acidobacteriaceae bacterium]